MVLILLGLLGLLALYFSFFWIRDLTVHRGNLGFGNWIINFIIGIVTNFFDALGIGSYAPTIMLLSVTRQLKSDKLLPGTLTTSDMIPVFVESIIFITVVKVDALTLFSLIIAALVGAAIGGRIVPKLPEKTIQVFIGIALLITAVLMLSTQMGWIAFLGKGNTALGLTGWKLILAIVLHFIYGALMTIGVGLYAPSMATIYMLGLNPLVAFPIMMGSCSALMAVSGKEFVTAGAYARKISIAICLGGIIGVVVAAKLVVSMNLTMLLWLVIVVVTYTGVYYLYKGIKNKGKDTPVVV